MPGAPVLRGLSERLQSFLDEYPHERRPIADFIRRAANAIPAGARVADIGAGDAPYRELFWHTDYYRIDWGQSVHEGAALGDIIATSRQLPVAEQSFDAVLLTQVLEHLPEPKATLIEALRVMKCGGSIYVTAPFVWELHELPHDYYRYTAAGLQYLLEEAGFIGVVVAPRNDCFTTLAQLMRNVRWAMGRSSEDGLDEQREAVADALDTLADAVVAFSSLDVKCILPLGYAATARRPEEKTLSGMCV